MSARKYDGVGGYEKDSHDLPAEAIGFALAMMWCAAVFVFVGAAAGF